MNVKKNILKIFWILAAVCVSASFLFAQANDGKAPLEFQKTTFTSAAGETVEAESVWLTTRETHSNPASPTIKIPIVRFKSTAAKAGFPIIYLAGGPGVSGIGDAKNDIFPIIQALREYGDVIVYDQRGTGAAEPSLKITQKTSMPLDATLDEVASRRYLVEQARAIAADIKQRGINLSSYNTSENAADLEVLRLALGAEKIVVWGHSYGSHLGLAYHKKHPEAVDKIILSGINGPDQRWRFGSNLDDLIGQIDNYLVLTPKLKRQMPSLKKSIENVFSKLEKQPVIVQQQNQTVKIGKPELQTLIALRSGDLEFVKMLPLMFGQMQNGDFTLAAQMVVSVVKQRDWGTAMAFSMHLASGVSPPRLREIETNAKSSLFSDALNFPFNDKEFSAVWEVADLGEDFRAPVKSSIPALFLSGNLDGRTSITEAAAISQNFPNAQTVLLLGASHNFYQQSPEILTVMQSFLENKKVPSKIELPIELRGGEERKIILMLRTLTMMKGVGEALKKLREMSKPDSNDFVSSYVFGTFGVILLRSDKKPKEALEIFKAGVEMFPDNLFLNERLGEAYEANGMTEKAVSQYKKCLELNRLNRRPAVRLAELEKNKS